MAMATVDDDHLAAWKRLTQQLDLAGADPERLSGVIECVRQEPQELYMMMRLDTPAPGIALVAAWGARPHVNASMTIFFYGDGAEARATASEQKWRDWLGERFVPSAVDRQR
jgi:hypothetical protein